MEFEYALDVYLGKKDINDIPIKFVKKVNELLKEPTNDLLNWVRSQKWEEIKYIRNNLEQSGLPFDDSKLDYDIISVIRLTQAKDGLKEAIDLGLIKEEEAQIEWTMYDNTVRNLTYAELKNIPLIAVHYTDALHQKAREYRNKIFSSNSIEEIVAIKWEE